MNMKIRLKKEREKGENNRLNEQRFNDKDEEEI